MSEGQQQLLQLIGIIIIISVIIDEHIHGASGSHVVTYHTAAEPAASAAYRRPRLIPVHCSSRCEALGRRGGGHRREDLS